MFGAGLPQSPAQASTQTATASAPVPVVGVQDSWINSCDGKEKAKTPNYAPNRAVPAVTSAYWQALGMNTVRFSPEWDIALPHAVGSRLWVVRQCFNYWLSQLAAHGVTPEIAFKPDTSYVRQVRKTIHVRIPTLRQYVAAVRAFHQAYPQVTIIAPWGEPEFHKGVGGNGSAYELANGSAFDATSCPKHATDANCGPVLAAQMWVAVTHLCPSCTVIAGDFGSNQGKDVKYLAIYHRYLRDIHGGHHVYHPDVWAVHPYTDVLAFEHKIQYGGQYKPLEKTLVGTFARQLARDGYDSGTSIWLDEVSSFMKSYRGEHYTKGTQAEGAYELLTRLIKAGGASRPGEPVVRRIYYMRFAGAADDALIVRGQPKPIYTTFVNWRKAHPAAQPAQETSAARATSAASAPAAPARYTIRDTADNLCLDANNKGPTAGQNGDEVRLWTCYGADSQHWYPVPA
jgi:hypothetical protein